MNITIKSKKLNKEFTFFRNAGDGLKYVYLEQDGNPGTLGDQICEGGAFSGNTVSCSQVGFESTCRRWYRAHMRRLEKEGVL